jgi:hypothetical protein
MRRVLTAGRSRSGCERCVRDRRAAEARVVVALASRYRLQALRYAMAEARRRSSPLRAVRVCRRRAAAGYGGPARIGRRGRRGDHSAVVRQAMGGAQRPRFHLIAPKGGSSGARHAGPSEEDLLVVSAGPTPITSIPVHVDRQCVHLIIVRLSSYRLRLARRRGHEPRRAIKREAQRRGSGLDRLRGCHRWSIAYAGPGAAGRCESRDRVRRDLFALGGGHLGRGRPRMITAPTARCISPG